MVRASGLRDRKPAVAGAGGHGEGGRGATERDQPGVGADGIIGPWRSPGGHYWPWTLTQSKMSLQRVLGRGLMRSDSHF